MPPSLLLPPCRQSAGAEASSRFPSASSPSPSPAPSPSLPQHGFSPLFQPSRFSTSLPPIPRRGLLGQDHQTRRQILDKPAPLSLGVVYWAKITKLGDQFSRQRSVKPGTQTGHKVVIEGKGIKTRQSGCYGTILYILMPAYKCFKSQDEPWKRPAMLELVKLLQQIKLKEDNLNMLNTRGKI